MRRAVVVALLAACAVVAAPAATASAAATSCTPLRAVFYTEDDWLRLGNALAANASPCAQYYISIPPLAADKTALRYDQPWRIHALGPQFHVLAEINYNGWNGWVTANNETWYDAGVEARRRMAAAGFDVAAGDSWALNELSSAVRGGVGTARQKIRDFVRGLYTGDGSTPATKGVVFDIGMGQSTSDLSTYKVALQDWYGDTAFWQDMSAYVGDWSQELYGDVSAEAVAGAPLASRVEHLDDFLGHQLTLANAGPDDAATARTFLQQAYNPLANAAWIWSDGFGDTNVPLAQMEDYVTAEVAALRSFDAANGFATDRFGFAWAPRMADGSAWTAQFTSDTQALLDRLAAALHDSDASPEAACGTTWCTAGLDGAAFTEAWQTFASWSPPGLAITTPSLSVQLETDGVADPASAPVTVTLASSSPTGTFAASPGGPWSSTLALTVPAGSSAASFYYSDATPGSPTLSATAAGRQTATQTVSVPAPAQPPPPAPAPAPAAAPAPSGGGGGVRPDLHVDLTANATTAPSPGSQLVYSVTVSTANAAASSGAQLVLALPAGFTVTKTYSDRGSGCTGTAPALTCDVAWISPGTSTHVTVWGTVGAAGEQDATATVTSLVEPEANPVDNTVTLRLAEPPAAAPTPKPKPHAKLKPHERRHRVESRRPRRRSK